MNTSFAELGLNEQILAGVEALGYSEPTPVQSQAIPLILQGRDVVATAQTGTGKTAAFTLPTLQLIGRLADEATERDEAAAKDATGNDGTTGDASGEGRAAEPSAGAPTKKRRRHKRTDRGPHALIITPTRELAHQIDDVTRVVAEKSGQVIVTAIGGDRYDRQIKRLSQGCDMLVATPGRLLDLHALSQSSLSHVRVLVLDEADRMLDMGFWPSVRKIIAQLPKQRQTLLFSATISGDIERSMPSMLNDPRKRGDRPRRPDGRHRGAAPHPRGAGAEGEPAVTPRRAGQAEPSPRVLPHQAARRRRGGCPGEGGRTVGVMHADRRQRDRERALANFRAGKLEILVATDVMSRGIDVEGIDWVVNFDVPLDPEDYVHRIGRTGRAGESGVAFTFMAPDEVSPLREIEYFTKQLVPVWEPEGFSFGAGRIVPNPKRAATRSARSMFSRLAKPRARAFGRSVRATHVEDTRPEKAPREAPGGSSDQGALRYAGKMAIIFLRLCAPRTDFATRRPKDCRITQGETMLTRAKFIAALASGTMFAAMASGCSILGIEDPNAQQTEPVDTLPEGAVDFENLIVALDVDSSVWAWTQIDNPQSQNNGALIVGVPATVTNNDEMSRVLSPLYCKILDPTGRARPTSPRTLTTTCSPRATSRWARRYRAPRTSSTRVREPTR